MENQKIEKWKWLFGGVVIGVIIGVIMTLVIGGATFYFIQEIMERSAFGPELLPITEPEQPIEPIFDFEGTGPRKDKPASTNIMEFFVMLQDERWEVAERYLTLEFAAEIEVAGGLKKLWAEETRGRAIVGTGVRNGFTVPEEYRVENVEQTASDIEIEFIDGTRKEYFVISRLVEGTWLIERIGLIERIVIVNWG